LFTDTATSQGENDEMNGFTRIGLAAVGSLIVASSAMAQGGPPTPEQKAQAAILTRQGLFKLQGFVFGPVGGMLRGAPFDAAVVEKAAARLQVLGTLIPEVFATDTHTFTGTPTKAREGIWTNKSDFDGKANDFVKAAADLEAAAKTGDKGATLKAAGAVGKSCGACHDQFRDK
jgi:cytochrome c556